MLNLLPDCEVSSYRLTTTLEYKEKSSFTYTQEDSNIHPGTILLLYPFHCIVYIVDVQTKNKFNSEGTRSEVSEADPQTKIRTSRFSRSIITINRNQEVIKVTESGTE